MEINEKQRRKSTKPKVFFFFFKDKYREKNLQLDLPQPDQYLVEELRTCKPHMEQPKKKKWNITTKLIEIKKSK